MLPRPSAPFLLAGLLAAQQQPTPAPADDELGAARQAVRTLGEQHRDLQQLECSYEQLRTSALLVEPLRSHGTLRWRREPACLLFEVASPVPARLRLDEQRYEVLRPQRRQLERFTFAGPELPRALLDAFAPDLQAIERRMQIREVTRTATGQPRLRIRFAPTDDALKHVLSSLSLELDPRSATLHAIAYTDAQGDEVELRLGAITRDPGHLPEQFELRPEPGTRVLEHPPPQPEQPEPAADAGTARRDG